MLLPFLVFLAVTTAVGAILIWLMPTRTERRLDAMVGGGERPWSETVVRMAGPLAKLSSPPGDWDTSPLRVRFFNAGIRQPSAQLIYYAAKTALPLAFGFFAYFVKGLLGTSEGMVLLFYVAAGAMAGTYVPNLVLWWLVRNRKREIFETFPDAADLMLVCVEAGLGLDAGLSKVAEEIKIKSVALAEELHLTNLEMRAGGSRDKALRNLAARTGVEELGTFAIMLTQADKFGTSIGDALRVFSDDLRHKRQVRAEEIAAKVPTKMLLPLVICIFPSILMVILGPAAIQVIRTLMPMMAGRG